VKATVFVGVSLDGQIARADGGLDWLPHDTTEDHGFHAFLASVDALVMGRATYDVVLGFEGAWAYGKTPVYVLSHRELEPAPAGAVVERITGTPAEIATQLGKKGIGRVYVDGGATIQQFLEAGLVDRVIVTWVPVLIGKGIPLFGATSRDIPLKHVATRTFPSGLVKSEYAVV
jgi:dihydrofolate reductase